MSLASNNLDLRNHPVNHAGLWVSIPQDERVRRASRRAKVMLSGGLEPYHKHITRVRSLTCHPKQFQQVPQLTVNVTTDGDG